MWYTSAPPVPDQMTEYVKFALNKQKNGEQLPFAVQKINAGGSIGKIVGSTRLYDIDTKNRRVRLGYTWYR